MGPQQKEVHKRFVATSSYFSLANATSNVLVSRGDGSDMTVMLLRSFTGYVSGFRFDTTRAIPDTVLCCGIHQSLFSISIPKVQQAIEDPCFCGHRLFNNLPLLDETLTALGYLSRSADIADNPRQHDQQLCFTDSMLLRSIFYRKRG